MVDKWKEKFNDEWNKSKDCVKISNKKIKLSNFKDKKIRYADSICFSFDIRDSRSLVKKIGNKTTAAKILKIFIEQSLSIIQSSNLFSDIQIQGDGINAIGVYDRSVKVNPYWNLYITLNTYVLFFNHYLKNTKKINYELKIGMAIAYDDSSILIRIDSQGKNDSIIWWGDSMLNASKWAKISNKTIKNIPIGEIVVDEFIFNSLEHKYKEDFNKFNDDFFHSNVGWYWTETKKKINSI